jgi:hypothetical protein
MMQIRPGITISDVSTNGDFLFIVFMFYFMLTRTGAIASFLGTTRDFFESKTVTHLEYEAYPEMALPCMLDICLNVSAHCIKHFRSSCLICTAFFDRSIVSYIHVLKFLFVSVGCVDSQNLGRREHYNAAQVGAVPNTRC